jgi:signal transduction histidine kinase
MAKKWVYLLDEVDQAEAYVGGEWDAVRGLLGGKGANLSEMVRINVPVPPGFTVTTEACNTYLASGETFPKGMREQMLEALKAIEKTTGKKFGDPKNPLLVSCRSGAKFSMPGMMDTVLNIGLNDKTAEGMIKLTGDERFVYDSYRRLIQMFGNVVMEAPDEAFEEVITEARLKAGVKTDAELSADDWKGVIEKFKVIFKQYAGRFFPTDPFEQLFMATEAVFRSWNGKRAVDYRNAAGISHEIRNPLGIIRSSAELLKKKVTKFDPTNSIPDIIVEEANRLNRIITDFINFAKPRSPNLVPCRIEEVIEKNITFLAMQIQENGYTIKQNYQNSLPEIQADAAMLYQSFLNILINAMQAMPNGGTIEIAIRANDKIVTINFEDEGQGISDEVIKKIWDPFFTTKEMGTGLGLGVVKNLIESHGGSIQIQNRSQGGARVTVELPVEQSN